MDSAGGAEAPKAPPLNPPLDQLLVWPKSFMVNTSLDVRFLAVIVTLILARGMSVECLWQYTGKGNPR